MDKIAQYKKIVGELVEYVFSICPTSKEVEIQKIMDELHGHYLLYSVGWEGSDWVYGSFVHIDVKSTGRVWIQHDGTDLRLADELALRGIPKSDMVIGFQAPHSRQFMEEFAAA